MNYTLDGIVKAIKAKGYKVDTKPYKLNVAGVRNSKNTSQSFDDKLAYFWYNDKGQLEGSVVDGTTDPSVMYLNKPLNKAGTAILKSGQYVDSYAIGLHQGKYEALRQVRPVTVIRDADRNSLLNMNAETQQGMFGINIHKAGVNSKGDGIIDTASAGCQVFRYVKDFNAMMVAAKKSRDLHGNQFTYTLLDERDVLQKAAKTAAVGIGLLLIAVSLFWVFSKTNGAPLTT